MYRFRILCLLLFFQMLLRITYKNRPRKIRLLKKLMCKEADVVEVT